MSAERIGPCLCEASLDYFWKVTATGRYWSLQLDSGKKQMSSPSSRRAQRRIQKTTDLSSFQSQAQRAMVTCTNTSWCGVVTTGMLQGLRLSPLLFNNLIKGLEVVGQECNLRKFADDTKLTWAFLFRQIWTGWRNGSTEAPGENAKSCTWREIPLHANTVLRTDHLESSFDQKTSAGPGGWPWATNLHLQQRPTVSLSGPGRVLPAAREISFYFSAQPWWETPGVLCIAQSYPAQVRDEYIGVSPAKDHNDRDDWRISLWRKGWESCVEKSQGDLITVCKYLISKAKLLSVAPSDSRNSKNQITQNSFQKW